MPEIVSADTVSDGVSPDNLLRQSKRVLPPVHVGSAMFPSVRDRQNLYWQALLSEAARESLLQRLVSYKAIITVFCRYLIY